MLHTTTHLPLLRIQAQQLIRLLLAAYAKIIVAALVLRMQRGDALLLLLQMRVEGREGVRVVQGEAEVVEVGGADGQEGAVAAWVRGCRRRYTIGGQDEE
jgi:hypothetical protein